MMSMLMLLAMGFVGAALITLGSSDVRVSGYERRGSQAQFAAEAGVQEAFTSPLDGSWHVHNGKWRHV